MGYSSLFLCMPDQFLLDDRHGEFYVVGCCHFLIPLGVWGPCSGMQLNYLEIILMV